MDHSNASKRIIEKFAGYNELLYMAFIDYEKAFDFIEIQAVLGALRRQGVPDVYVHTMSNIYKHYTAALLIHEKSRKIPIKRGVGQGDTISPMSFTVCLEEVFQRLDWEEKGIRTDGEYLRNLRLPEYIVLISNDVDELQQMIEDLNRESQNRTKNE